MSALVPFDEVPWWLLAVDELDGFLAARAKADPAGTFTKLTIAERLRRELELSDAQVLSIRCGQLRCIYQLAQLPGETVGRSSSSWERRIAVKLAGADEATLEIALMNVRAGAAYWRGTPGTQELVRLVPPLDRYEESGDEYGLIDWAKADKAEKENAEWVAEARAHREPRPVDVHLLLEQIQKGITRGGYVNITGQLAAAYRSSSGRVVVDAADLAWLTERVAHQRAIRARYNEHSLTVVETVDGQVIARGASTLGDLRHINERQLEHMQRAEFRYLQLRRYLSLHSAESDEEPVRWDELESGPPPPDEDE